tara:strand:+ start:140 stop:538 length:399 start_codon:yes stop_codon:yes gene_type:complete
MKKLILILIFIFSNTAKSDHLDIKTEELVLENVSSFLECGFFYHITLGLHEDGFINLSKDKEIKITENMNNFHDEATNLMNEVHFTFEEDITFTREIMNRIDKEIESDNFSDMALLLNTKYKSFCEKLAEYL